MAEVDWTRYGSFKSTRCDDPKTIADILESAKGLRFDNGGGRTLRGTNGIKITRAETIRATADKLVCQLRFSLVYRGTRQTMSGRYTIQIYSDGRWRTTFDPS